MTLVELLDALQGYVQALPDPGGLHEHLRIFQERREILADGPQYACSARHTCEIVVHEGHRWKFLELFFVATSSVDTLLDERLRALYRALAPLTLPVVLEQLSAAGEDYRHIAEDDEQRRHIDLPIRRVQFSFERDDLSLYSVGLLLRPSVRGADTVAT